MKSVYYPQWVSLVGWGHLWVVSFDWRYRVGRPLSPKVCTLNPKRHLFLIVIVSAFHSKCVSVHNALIWLRLEKVPFLCFAFLGGKTLKIFEFFSTGCKDNPKSFHCNQVSGSVPACRLSPGPHQLLSENYWELLVLIE